MNQEQQQPQQPQQQQPQPQPQPQQPQQQQQQQQPQQQQPQQSPESPDSPPSAAQQTHGSTKLQRALTQDQYLQSLVESHYFELVNNNNTNTDYHSSNESNTTAATFTNVYGSTHFKLNGGHHLFVLCRSVHSIISINSQTNVLSNK